MLPAAQALRDPEPERTLRPSAELGADKGAVYGDWLGLDEAERASLKHEGVI